MHNGCHDMHKHRCEQARQDTLQGEEEKFMINLDAQGELGRDKHVQPGDLVGDFKDDQSKNSTEETLKEVANHVVGG